MATISNNFRLALSAVDTAHGGLGNAVADMLAIGHCEYLNFDLFKADVKAGLAPASWATVTNYMAPMGRAWLANRVSEFCETASVQGIKAALKLFPAGTGKRGENGKVQAVEAVQPAETMQAAPALDNDALIASVMLADEMDALKVENAALFAENAALLADNATLRAELAVLAAMTSQPAKKRVTAKA